ncbi:putative protein YieF [Chlamydiales bacterium STE3]|nr:putative protein YieF [Chlamydiales bacterium STE3]
MEIKPKILAFAGSLRKDSFNKKLLKVAAKCAENAGAEITLIELNDYPLPLYNEDIEKAEGLPKNVQALKTLMRQSDGLIISTPEYNSSLPAVLKNVIDWTSRKESSNEVNLSCFVDKIALILSASPGNLGGIRSLAHLRSILENISTIVLPGQQAISNADKAFAEDGHLLDEKQQQAVDTLAKKFVTTLRKFKSD